MEFNHKEAHFLAIPYPSQGHINPMLQFCKRLSSKGAKTTLAITNFIAKSMKPESDTVIDTISDGCDGGGFKEAESIPDYLNRLEISGSESLERLIMAKKESNHPFDCIIYDAFLPWALEVAHKCGVKAACFFTQACAVNFVYYYINKGFIKVPITSPTPVEIPGLPTWDLNGMPSFVRSHGSYPAYFEMVLNQFSNVEEADFVLVNTFYELESTVVDKMAGIYPTLTIGPTIPSFFLDKSIQNDNAYGLDLFPSNDSASLDWLKNKPKGSVIYVAFGSMIDLGKVQIQELSWGLKRSNFYILWAINNLSDREWIPQEILLDDKFLIVNWSPQLQVLADDALGCFFSHGGWNSTIEAISIGVSMIVLPQWTDQTMNAKLVEDVWGVGIRVEVDSSGIASKDEIERCIKDVMESEKGNEIKRNASKYKKMALEAVREGGTTDLCINKFLTEFV